MTAALPALVLSLLAADGARWLGPPPSAEVKRVVTIAPSLTQTVVSLGRARLLVGVSRFDELPEVKGLPRVGGFSDPSVESVVALKPDLVVVQMAPGNQRPVETLASLGITVLALPLTTVADVKESIAALGAALSAPEAAKAVVADIDAALAEARAAAKQRQTAPRVMLVYGFKPLVVAGPGTYAHELLTACGAVNVAEASASPYPVFPLERAVALQPDVILDAADAMEGKHGVKALRPLRRARWVTLSSKSLLHPGPSLAQGVRELSRVLGGADAGR